jgi:murein DD-endopeptidase MepM/ murein hydrolase activator NlpD
VQPGETVYSIAELYGVAAGSLTIVNNLADPNRLQVGQSLAIPVQTLPTAAPLQAPFAIVSLSEPVIVQGKTLVVYVTLSEPALLSGMFENQPLFFHPDQNGQQWAITAIHAMLAPGEYPVLLIAATPDGRQIVRIETVTVAAGPYGRENITLDDDHSSLLAPDLLAQEQQKLLNLWTQVTPQPLWQGSFWYPIAPDSLNMTSYFGTRRTYNNNEAVSFHAGVDFSGAGQPIFAPAAGTVVLAERLTVRGNAVVIDHGLGLYSGYWHQSQLVARVGQQVQPGQLIGYIGGTGLATGPHLHWELRLNGIAVNPLQWVQESIP